MCVSEVGVIRSAHHVLVWMWVIIFNCKIVFYEHTITLCVYLCDFSAPLVCANLQSEEAAVLQWPKYPLFSPGMGPLAPVIREVILCHDCVCICMCMCEKAICFVWTSLALYLAGGLALGETFHFHALLTPLKGRGISKHTALLGLGFRYTPYKKIHKTSHKDYSRWEERSDAGLHQSEFQCPEF